MSERKAIDEIYQKLKKYKNTGDLACLSEFHPQIKDDIDNLLYGNKDYLFLLSKIIYFDVKIDEAENKQK